MVHLFLEDLLSSLILSLLVGPAGISNYGLPASPRHDAPHGPARPGMAWLADHSFRSFQPSEEI